MDARLARLGEPHVAPLMALIEALREEGYDVPNVDPADGGVKAKALFLLESPGPRAVGTGFISRENPDPSARNMCTSLNQAGFKRSDVFLWNVVPYCVSSSTENRNASSAQIVEAAPTTQKFVDLLPDLQVVVFCGRKAQRAASLLQFGAKVKRLETFHPGAMSYNRLRNRTDIHQTFAEAFSQLLPL